MLDELPEPYRTMVWLVCTTGVRIGELLALRWRSVDWDRTCFWVVEAVDRSRFYSPKTHRSRRPILLADEDMKRLTEFRRRTGRAGEDDWLFLNRFGTGPIHADKALETLQSAAKRVGTWHLHLSRGAERQAADAVSRHFRDSGTGKTWSESGSKFGSKSEVGDTVVAVSR
jgi:integrase